MALKTLRLSRMSAVPKVLPLLVERKGVQMSRFGLSLLMVLVVCSSLAWASFIPDLDRTASVQAALNPAASPLTATADWDLIGAPETTALILGDVTVVSRRMDSGNGLFVDIRQSELLVGTSPSSETNGGGSLSTAILVMFALGALVKYLTSDAYRRFITEVYFPQSY